MMGVSLAEVFFECDMKIEEDSNKIIETEIILVILDISIFYIHDFISAINPSSKFFGRIFPDPPALLGFTPVPESPGLSVRR